MAQRLSIDILEKHNKKSFALVCHLGRNRIVPQGPDTRLETRGSSGLSAEDLAGRADETTEGVEVNMPIYGVIVHKGGNGYTVLSTNKKKLDAFKKREEAKGFKVTRFYRAYTTIRVSGEAEVADLSPFHI